MKNPRVEPPDPLDFEVDVLDHLLAPGHLILLAARPALGKTSLASQVVLRWALKEGIRVQYHSLEMPERQLMDRMSLTLEGSSHEGGLQSGVLTVDDAPGVHVAEVAQRCRESSPGMVVVDYVQLIGGSEAPTRKAALESFMEAPKPWPSNSASPSS